MAIIEWEKEEKKLKKCCNSSSMVLIFCKLLAYLPSHGDTCACGVHDTESTHW